MVSCISLEDEIEWHLVLDVSRASDVIDANAEVIDEDLNAHLWFTLVPNNYITMVGEIMWSDHWARKDDEGY